LPVRCAIAAFLALYGCGGGGRGTVGTVTETVRMGVETVVDVGTAVVTDATGAVTVPTVLAAVAAGCGDGGVSCCGSDAADAPPAETGSLETGSPETGSFVGALRGAPCPVTAGSE
jgi:hypothetical protein